MSASRENPRVRPKTSTIKPVDYKIETPRDSRVSKKTSNATKKVQNSSSSTTKFPGIAYIDNLQSKEEYIKKKEEAAENPSLAKKTRNNYLAQANFAKNPDLSLDGLKDYLKDFLSRRRTNASTNRRERRQRKRTDVEHETKDNAAHSQLENRADVPTSPPEVACEIRSRSTSRNLTPSLSVHLGPQTSSPQRYTSTVSPGRVIGDKSASMSPVKLIKRARTTSMLPEQQKNSSLVKRNSLPPVSLSSPKTAMFNRSNTSVGSPKAVMSSKSSTPAGSPKTEAYKKIHSPLGSPKETASTYSRRSTPTSTSQMNVISISSGNNSPSRPPRNAIEGDHSSSQTEENQIPAEHPSDSDAREELIRVNRDLKNPLFEGLEHEGFISRDGDADHVITTVLKDDLRSLYLPTNKNV